MMMLFVNIVTVPYKAKATGYIKIYFSELKLKIIHSLLVLYTLLLSNNIQVHITLNKQFCN